MGSLQDDLLVNNWILTTCQQHGLIPWWSQTIINKYIVDIISLMLNYTQITSTNTVPNKCMMWGMPGQAKKVLLAYEAIEKQITLEPEPSDPSATFPWTVAGRTKQNE